MHVLHRPVEPASFIIHGQIPPQSPENHIVPDHSLTWSRIGAHTMLPKTTWFHRLPEILDVRTERSRAAIDKPRLQIPSVLDFFGCPYIISPALKHVY